MNSAITAYVRVLRIRWRWMVWGVLIALGATTMLLIVQPPMYRTEQTVFVRTPGDVSRVLDGGDTYAQGRAKTYAAVASSPSLSARVISDLGLDLEPRSALEAHQGPSPRRHRSHRHRCRGTITAESPLGARQFFTLNSRRWCAHWSRFPVRWCHGPSWFRSIRPDHPSAWWRGDCRFLSCWQAPL